MLGRPPMGVKLIDALEGSAEAKERARVILETISGSRTVSDACEALGIEETRFHELRREALEGLLGALAPRPAGRPPVAREPRDERIRELERELKLKEVDLKAAELRTEIALVMPQVLQDGGLKKGASGKGGR